MEGDGIWVRRKKRDERFTGERCGGSGGASRLSLGETGNHAMASSHAMTSPRNGAVRASGGRRASDVEIGGKDSLAFTASAVRRRSRIGRLVARQWHTGEMMMMLLNMEMSRMSDVRGGRD